MQKLCTTGEGTAENAFSAREKWRNSKDGRPLGGQLLTWQWHAEGGHVLAAAFSLSNSPDFFVWGCIKYEVFDSPLLATLRSLKARIRSTYGHFFVKCWKISGKKQSIALMFAEPQTECMLNSVGVSEHIVKFPKWWKFYFGLPYSLCKIHFWNRSCHLCSPPFLFPTS